MRYAYLHHSSEREKEELKLIKKKEDEQLKGMIAFLNLPPLL